MVQNLTEGRPLKLLFFFALPMVAGNLFQQLYNMVDTMVVGKFVGEDAVAAVGSSFPIVFLSVAVASGLSMGSNVVVSQLFGAGRIHEMKSTISTAIISLSVLGLIIMALGAVLAGIGVAIVQKLVPWVLGLIGRLVKWVSGKVGGGR